ncbi:Co2+/Mg2+ efflux protein ApaG [Vibrio salinus]|uniref:Co2+/Mg2+ efflux protein ApaG n=1 Tax=Vibrio salinus TaxID=2899784 RepID=UPI001E4D6E0C|nr:Co2+/Mg2+ efflux protein ApaG [Vibrio salinus]MCE0494114.1 Co2+/Mg2+ efflux protein ApaG [Vibrio salinus]
MVDSIPCINVLVQSQFIPEQSTPEHNRYVFAYTITIQNQSSEQVRLMSRRWLITDANGKQLIIEGDGVVGEQPVILAGNEYTYTSGTAIETPVGVMQGHYIMYRGENIEFIAKIPPFRLSVPNILN